MGTIKQKVGICLLTWVLALVLFPVSSALAERDNQAYEDGFSQVVMVVLDRIMLEDLMMYSGPFLQSIMEKSGLGLMNVNTAETPGTESGYLSMGSGARLSGNWTAGKAYNREEEGFSPVTALYQRHTGVETVPQGEVLHVYTGTLKQLNSQRPYPFFIGLMGEAIKAKGFHAAVLGNADTDTEGRQAVLMAMDAAGSVSYGDVSSAVLREDERFPFGLRSDAEAYEIALERIHGKARLIVVDWGDTKRIDAYLPHLPQRRRGELLEETFGELDRFLSKALPLFSEDTRLLMVTPSPPGRPVTGGQLLTPVLYYNLQHPEPGRLTSNTTRREGIVASTDIAPTVLSYLDLPSPMFLFGAPLKVVTETDPLCALTSISEYTKRIYTQRGPLIRGYVLAQIIFLLWGAVGLFSSHRLFHYSRYGLYSLLGFPLAVVLSPVVPFFPAASVYINAAFLVLLTVGLVLFAFALFRRDRDRLSFLALLTFSVLAVDLFGGAVLNSRSFLGYDPIAGARYYGLGNEYMGIMVGSFLFGFLSFGAALRDREKQAEKNKPTPARVSVLPTEIGTSFLFPILFFVFGLLLVFLMASPRYGANFGGAITSGVGVGVASAGVLNRPYSLSLRQNLNMASLKSGWVVLLFVSLTGLFLYLLNTRISGEAVSHLGRTWELVQVRGLEELVNVIVRKAEMNIKLLRYSIWSRIFLVLVGLVTVLTFYPAGFMKKMFGRHPFFKTVLSGIIAGSITALLINDSGVVAAATTMLYGVVPLLVLGRH